MYNSISFYDWQAILYLFQAVGLVAIVGVGILFMMQTKAFARYKRYKPVLLLVFVVWMVASVGLEVQRTYGYFSNERKTLVESIDMQKKQYGQ